MELAEFRGLCLEKLHERGFKIIGEDRYFPESAIISMIDVIYSQTGIDQEIQIVDFDQLLSETIERAFQKLLGEPQGGQPEKTDF